MSRWIPALAELAVRYGVNLQPGQVLRVRYEPGQEELMREVVAQAYDAGAKFVDALIFDPWVKRARALHADPDTLEWVPPWYGQALLELGEIGGAMVSFSGASDPSIMEGVDPERLGRDMLPRLREGTEIVGRRLANWSVVPCPTPAWAELVFPSLEPEAALERLWEEIAHICRLEEPDPIAAWAARLDRLLELSEKLTALSLDSLVLEGPGTSLSVGLLPETSWSGARWETAGGIVHAPNLPTEEVFTTPDPERVEGHVRSTKPLVTSGTVIRDLEVRFAGGRVVDVRASSGAETFRALASRDEGAGRLGEVALVDRESRIGQRNTVFFDTLLDENAASHIAIGEGFPFLTGDSMQERVNQSRVHLDFMIGSDEVEVTGLTAEGREIPLLRGGAWQI